MICPECHTENNPGDRFCEQCGAALPAVTAAATSADTDGNGAAATLVGAPPSDAVLIRQGDGNQSFALGNRVVVGRLDTCDIPIHDKSVSREHARLSALPGGYVVEDLGSTNGTMVNGQRIHDATMLRPGDTVTFGSIEFHYQQEAPAPATPEPDESAASSTQPFEYRPPEATVFPSPAVEPAPEPSPPMDFPPLQPFTPIPDAAAEREEPAPVPQEIAPAPAADEEAAAPAAEEAPVEPVPSPQEPPAWAAPPREPAPQESHASAAPVEAASPPPPVGDSLADDVVDTAARLGDLVRALADQVREGENQRTELTSRVQALESASETIESVRTAVQAVPTASVSEDQLKSMSAMLDQLVQQPRDIELLMQVGRSAGDLAAVVTEYTRLRQFVDDVAGATNPTSGR